MIGYDLDVGCPVEVLVDEDSKELECVSGSNMLWACEGVMFRVGCKVA